MQDWDDSFQKDDMPKPDLFESYIYERFAKAMAAWKDKDAGDIYALSFYLDFNQDVPQLTLGYNTNAQVAKKLSSASGPDEARWNYAFWLQNEEVVIGERDPKAKKLYADWLKDEKID